MPRKQETVVNMILLRDISLTETLMLPVIEIDGYGLLFVIDNDRMGIS